MYKLENIPTKFYVLSIGKIEQRKSNVIICKKCDILID
jgi:hypothetical protein